MPLCAQARSTCKRYTCLWQSHAPLRPGEDALEFGGENDLRLVSVLAPVGASALLLGRVRRGFGFRFLLALLCLLFLRVGADDLLGA
jgi:hypothetical protein